MEYLFWLANLCSLGAPEVDRLAVADFAAYIDGIDSYLKHIGPGSGLGR